MKKHVTQQTVPASALRFAAGSVHFDGFSAAGATGSAGAVPPPHDVDLVLRTAAPVQHPYWGSFCHDFAGMTAHKDTFALDYCHNPDELVGHFSNLDASSGELRAKGTVVPFQADDRASEILHRAAAGTPYEASIMCDPDMTVEELDEGECATVNGRQVNGPAVIARRWALRGAALCPAGKDKYTSAAFSAAAENEPVTVTITRNAMANATEPVHQSAVPESFWAGLLSLLSLRPKSAAADATGSASAAAATALRPESAAADATGSASAAAATGATGSASAALKALDIPYSFYDESHTNYSGSRGAWLHAEGARFLEKFGAAGARWFAEGLSYGEAQDRYAAALAEENEALKTRMAGAQLAGAAAGGPLSFGEEQPLSSEAAGTDAVSPALTDAQRRYGKNLGAFMLACAPPKE